MTNTISFKNLESLEHLKEFINEHIDHTIGQFVQNRSLRANIIVEKKGQSHPDYSCEIVIYHPALRKQIVARKSSHDFYKSVRDTCRAIEKNLRRFAQTKSKLRHKSHEFTKKIYSQKETMDQGENYELAKNA